MEVLYSSSLGGKTSKKAKEILKAAAEAAEQTENPHAQGMVALAVGGSAFLRGEWPPLRLHSNARRRSCVTRVSAWLGRLSPREPFKTLAYYFLGEIAQLARTVSERFEDAENRGDLYELTHLRLGYGSTPWLALDNPERALRVANEAEAQWSKSRFYFQHYVALLAKTQAMMYLGKGRQSLELVEAAWPPLKASMQLKTHYATRRCDLAARPREPVRRARGGWLEPRAQTRRPSGGITPRKRGHVLAQSLRAHPSSVCR